MKKFLKAASFLTAISVVAGSFAMSAFAAGDANVVIGTKLSFEEGNEPFIYEERTMMPLRAVSEALDATVFWFDDSSSIQIVSYDTLLLLQIGKDVMAKYKIENGEANKDDRETVQLEVAPMIHNDRTYVPLRAIAEAFEANITWDNPTRSAIIIPKEKETYNVTVSEMTGLPNATLCSTYGVICKRDGSYYLRSLTENAVGEYAEIYFCTPKETSLSDDTDYDEYISRYWAEQFGSENPAGMVVRYTGFTVAREGAVLAALDKTTTGIKSLGYYDDYMKSLGLDYIPFSSLNM